MSNMPSNSPANQGSASHQLTWMHQVATLLSPFIIVAIGGLFTWLHKLDDRQYMMKDEYLSKNDFNLAVARLETSIDTRMATFQSALDSRHKENAAQMDRVLVQLSQVNDKLNTLAVDLEKKTKK